MKPQRLYINGKFLLQRATGVQNYATGISLALQEAFPDCLVIAPRGRYDQHGLKVKKCGWGRGFFWEQICLPLFMIFHPGAVLINLCNSAPLMMKNEVVTIHDLSFLEKKNWFKPAFVRWYRFLIPRIARRARSVVTVSEFSRKAIIAELQIPANKIHIVPNGLPPLNFDEARPFPFPYLLLTGVYNPRKNADFVFSLLPAIKSRGLHVVGLGDDAPIYNRPEIPNDECLHLLDYVTDRQYCTLMKHAAALVFPGRHEGFGIPLLEALCLGSKVLAADIPVFRESFGDLPVYFQPDEKSSFLAALDKLANHEIQEGEIEFLKKRFNFANAASELRVILSGFRK